VAFNDHVSYTPESEYNDLDETSFGALGLDAEGGIIDDGESFPDMAALLAHIGFDKMPPSPSPSDEEEITYEDFVKSKRFCNDAEELEGIGVFLGDPCDDNNMNIGAFMYADVANIELNDDGSFYLCIDRTAYSTMGAHAVPLHELEYHLYTWATSEHAGYIKNPM